MFDHLPSCWHVIASHYMNLTERMRDFWLAHPDTWIGYRELALEYGIGGWRTRISECRRRYGMQIDQRLEMVLGPDGRQFYRLSEYRYTTNGAK